MRGELEYDGGAQAVAYQQIQHQKCSGSWKREEKQAKMDAVVAYAAKDFRLEHRPMPPPPGPGEVLVKVTAVGICKLSWRGGGSLGGPGTGTVYLLARPGRRVGGKCAPCRACPTAHRPPAVSVPAQQS